MMSVKTYGWISWIVGAFFGFCLGYAIGKGV